MFGYDTPRRISTGPACAQISTEKIAQGNVYKTVCGTNFEVRWLTFVKSD